MATIYPASCAEVTAEIELSNPDALLRSLRGQEIVLCDLTSIFDGWPKEINHNLDRVRQDVDVWLERCELLFSRNGTSSNHYDLSL